MGLAENLEAVRYGRPRPRYQQARLALGGLS